MMYEYPPILRGTPEQQLREMRDYLVRLIKEMNEKEQERQGD